VRRIIPLVVVVALAGCGSSKQAAPSPPPSGPDDAMRALVAKAQPALAGGKVRTLYRGSEWSVVEVTKGDRAFAAAFRLVGDRWRPDRSGRVKVRILGPDPGTRAPRQPQVAIEMIAPTRLVESALWLDGNRLLEKGGGSPTRGTIYGAPPNEIRRGTHVAVGYARSATLGTAVAWVFKV
jgi:hypothetical protein